MPRKKRQPEKLELVYRRTADLVPDPNNARRHPPEQIEQLRKSFRRFGVYGAIMLKDDDKTIGAGNGRWEAATMEGIDPIPTITKRGLSETEWRALALADNRIAMNATWDTGILTSELGSLKDLGIDLGDLGFSIGELGSLGVPGFTLPERIEAAEETPDPPKNPVIKRGELWTLGPHRLMCGDSTSAADIGRLLSGSQSPHLMATDPPYGVNYNPGWRGESHTGDGKRLSLGVHAKGKVQNDDQADWTEAWRLFPGDVAYIWCASMTNDAVIRSLETAQFIRRTQIIWVKNNIVVGRGDYHWQHECCWYAVKKGKTGPWAGDRKQSSVWNIAKPQKSETGHGTQKPVECMRRPILNNSKPGDAVYEPFAGSFTTGIACEMEGRIALACEIDPAYVQVGIERWQNLTGKKAQREDGATLEKLMNAVRRGKK